MMCKAKDKQSSRVLPPHVKSMKDVKTVLSQKFVAQGVKTDIYKYRLFQGHLTTSTVFTQILVSKELWAPSFTLYQLHSPILLLFILFFFFLRGRGVCFAVKWHICNDGLGSLWITHLFRFRFRIERTALNL